MGMEPTSDISICSNALLLIGDNAINSLKASNNGVQNSYSAQVAASLYPRARNLLIGSHPWRFCTTQDTLGRLTAVPLFDQYKYAYQLPAGYLKLIKVEGRPKFDIYKKLLYTNAPNINIEYTFLPDEEAFPDYFTNCLELRMAAIFARAIAEDKSKAADYKEELRDALVIAKSIDNQNHPARHINADAFTRVRDGNRESDDF